ncbi:MAG TPA: DUF4430 domain-containing protein [Clostridiaceae bacterium]
MKSRKRIISILVLFTFILAQAAGLFGTFVRAAGTNQVQVVVQSSSGVIASGNANSLKASEAIDQVLKNSGKDSAVIDNGMISSIDGVANDKVNWSKYWFTAINRGGSYADVNVGINDLMLQNGDKLIVYYSAFDTYTANKIEYSTTLPNKKLTISLNNEQLDWSTGKNVVTPISSPTMKAWIDGQPVSLNQNKAVIENGLSEGNHSLKVSDYQTDSSLMPRVVEDTFNFEIKIPTCSVRVEGLNDTMLQGTDNGGSALEIVKNVLGKNNVEYKTIKSDVGEYITEIGGLAQNDIASSTGWMFYVKNSSSIISPAVGMDSYVPADGDEIVLYFTDFNVPYVNSIKFTPDVVPVNGSFSMRFSYNYTDWTDWTKPVEAVKKIGGALVTIDDTNYVTDTNGEITIPAGLSSGVHTYMISGYNSGRLSTVVMDKGTFSIDGANSPSFNFSKSNYDSSQNQNNLLVNKDIPGSISAAAAVVKGYSDPWAYVSMKKLGMAVNSAYLDQAYTDISKNGASGYSNTELEKLIFGLTASGYSPYSFAGQDLVGQLYGRDANTFLIADVIYGLLAMDYANIPDTYSINRQSLKSRLLSLKVSNGAVTGWSLADSMDPDITGAAICALSPYMGEQEVTAAVNSAVVSLSNKENESGYVTGQYGISSETNAFVILGILSVGVNPEGVSTLSDGTKVNFAKSKGDLLSAMLSFKAEDGTFKHTMDGTSNSIATEECLRALISTSEYKKSGKAYNYYSGLKNADALKTYSAPVVSSQQIVSATAGTDSVSSIASEGNSSDISSAGGNIKAAGRAADASATEVAKNETPVLNAEQSAAAEEKATISKKNNVYMTLGGGMVAMGVVGGAVYLMISRKEGLR